MIRGELIISASTDFDGDTSFDVSIRLGALQIQVYFWGEADWFRQFGEGLSAFPASIDDVIEFEVGQIKPPSHQNYLLIRAYCYDGSGHSALKIIMHNNEPEPHALYTEFSIPTEAAALNTLGNRLKNWQPSERPELVWETQIN